MNDDGSVKIFAKQYVSKAGNKYYWGKFGGFEVRIFKGKPHEGTPQLDVYVRQVDEERREDAPAQNDQDDDSIPF